MLGKRIIDILFSGLLLVLILPILIFLSIAIKLDSAGPVFFRHVRVGRYGKPFGMLKFRSMVQNAENLGGYSTARDDPRITKFGRFIRKTSLDELPQLINVFKGDMSLVGPRPPVPSEVNQYQLAHRRRLSMRPGITCTWQVNGRNSIPFEKWMELDKKYIDDWSLWLDFKILAKTIPAVLRGSGT